MKNKKLKKFLTKKGGLYSVLITMGLCILALVLIGIGYVYGSLGGDWNRFWLWFTEPLAISIYVITLLVVMFLVIIRILIKRNEDIK